MPECRSAMSTSSSARIELESSDAAACTSTRAVLSRSTGGSGDRPSSVPADAARASMLRRKRSSRLSRFPPSVRLSVLSTADWRPSARSAAGSRTEPRATVRSAIADARSEAGRAAAMTMRSANLPAATTDSGSSSAAPSWRKYVSASGSRISCEFSRTLP
jgi:hypothetical protein